MLTYQDYVNAFNQQYGNNSEGGVNSPLSQQSWGLLSPQAQWNNVGGAFSIDPSDPRYQGLLGQTHGDAGRNIQIHGNATPDWIAQNVVNPSGVASGDGYTAIADNNFTPESQARTSGSFSPREIRDWAAAAAALFGGAALAGGAGLLGTEGSTLSATGSADIGAGASGSASFAGLDGGAAGVAGAQAGGASGTPGMIAPGMENSALADSYLINNGMPSLAGGNMTAALSSGGLSGLTSQAGSWALSHPIQALGLVQTAGSLFGNAGSSSRGANSSSGKEPGGTGVAMNIQRPQFQQNPYLAQQLRLGGYQQ